MALVSKRWQSLFFSEPGLWRSLSLQPGALTSQRATPLAWYASKTWLLRRITGLVTTVDVQDSRSIIECLSDSGPPGSLALPDLLWLLQPGVLRGVAIQHSGELPAAVAAVLPRFPQLTSLTLHCQHLPTNTPGIVSRLGQLRSLCWRGSSVSYLLMDSILHLQHLTSLELSSAFMLPHTQSLTQLPQLQHLELRSGELCGGFMQPPMPKECAAGRGLSSFCFSQSLRPIQASIGRVGSSGAACSWRVARHPGNSAPT